MFPENHLARSPESPKSPLAHSPRNPPFLALPGPMMGLVSETPDPLAFRYMKQSQLETLSPQEKTQVLRNLPKLLAEWYRDLELAWKWYSNETKTTQDKALSRIAYYRKLVQDAVVVQRMTFKRALKLISAYKSFFTGAQFQHLFPNRMFRGSSGWCGTGQDEYYEFSFVTLK